MRRVRCTPFLFLLLASLAPRPASAGYYQDMPKVEELRRRLQAQEGARPQDAVNEYQAFLQQNPNLDPLAAVEVVSDIIRIRYKALKQTDLAMQLADWAIQQYGKSPAVVRPIGDKAMLLVEEKRPEEAVALVEKEWARLMRGWADQPGHALQQYCRALDQLGRKDEATAALRRAIYENATFLSGWWQGIPRAWMYARIIDDLLAKNQCDEALRWGKLRFITAGWKPETVRTEVMPTLQRIWVTRDLSDRNWKAFLAAQEDPARPNPLADVKLPDPDVEALEAQLQERPLNDEGRMHVLLALGKPGQAMVTAREYLVAHVEAPYADTLVRAVYHAVDLNFVRAEAFMKWREKGEGPNPLDEFFRQHPPEKEGEAKPQ